ncbi:MAG: hypothetical protein KU37_08980 [Sulfuricurvum sp. PC08-66]|nr:MAG: hypothetical protein KU37_08980 [Sulfuricurvum sp. PC08-66]
MKKIHRATQRGSAEHGWLHAKFYFSFDRYVDRSRMGFGTLRVINDDIIEPSGGFGMHPHSNMEIVTIALEGALEHRDSMGNHGTIERGEIQYMRAGTGVVHSEFNASATQRANLFQIWILPKLKDLPPAYAQMRFDGFESTNTLLTLVSPDGRAGSMAINQDAFIHSLKLQADHTYTLPEVMPSVGRLLLIVEGSCTILGETLERRDEMQIVDEHEVIIHAIGEVHLLIFEVVV